MASTMRTHMRRADKAPFELAVGFKVQVQRNVLKMRWMELNNEIRGVLLSGNSHVQDQVQRNMSKL